MTSLTDYAFYGLQILPAVAAVLFPAALLARHPDAATRMPVLLLGTSLFALVQLLLILATPLAPSFEAATPTTTTSRSWHGRAVQRPDPGGRSPWSCLHRARPLVGPPVRGPGRGLDRLGRAARNGVRHGVRDRGATRLDLGASVPPIVSVYIGSSVVLGILRVAAWAYVLTSAIRGTLAGEEPSTGWRFAASGAGIVLFALALVNLVGLITVPERGSSMPTSGPS